MKVGTAGPGAVRNESGLGAAEEVDDERPGLATGNEDLVAVGEGSETNSSAELTSLSQCSLARARAEPWSDTYSTSAPSCELMMPW